MGPIPVIGAAAALVWGANYVRAGRLLTCCTAFVVLGYVFPHPFWHANIGVTTLTVDRLALAGVVVMLLFHFHWTKLAVRRMVGCDWLLVALVIYLTARCATTPPAGEFHAHVGPWWRIIASFWMPAVLYAAIRAAPLSQSAWRLMLWCLTCLGAYLAWTAIAEVHLQWWAVFPRFISDPNLGPHFGRARGPALMSASLGVFLTVCFWASWFLWPRVSHAAKVVLTGVMLAMAVGTYYTYTRSTWLGLGGGLAVITLLQIPRRRRVPVAVGCLLIAVIGLLAFGDRLTKMGRSDANGSAEHSAYQRASFAYLSLQMFRDAPVFGCGVSRFYDKKLPYLSDRSQPIELESLRQLDHHNTLLSILVETGLVGCTLFVALLATWSKASWDLIRQSPPGSWLRAQGLFSLAVMTTYLATALFHDLTLSPTEHWLLFMSAGVTVAMLTERRRAPAAAVSPNQVAVQPVHTMPAPRPTPSKSEPKRVQRPAQINLFGMTIDALDMPGAVAKVLRWCAAPATDHCRYVVTPNVDHAVMFQSDAQLRSAYRNADLVLADGAPVVLASRLLDKGLPERVAGSDLAPALFRRASKTGCPSRVPRRRLRVFLLGAAEGVALRAQENIEARWAGVEIVGVDSPPLGFENDEAENQRILQRVAAARPDLLLIGLGAPKQELWVSRHADRLEAKVALCVGATIDFLAGERQRAPQWMRTTGLEWVHRLANEPGRLAKRYLRDACIFPTLVWRDWLKGEA